MSTVAEIKAAIDKLSPQQRDQLEKLLHPDWDTPLPQNEAPPNVREKVAEAARGKFSPGNHSNVSKLAFSL